MFEEPWITFILLFVAVAGVIGGALVQDWLTARAAARRHDASAHSAE